MLCTVIVKSYLSAHEQTGLTHFLHTVSDLDVGFKVLGYTPIQANGLFLGDVAFSVGLVNALSVTLLNQ